MRLNLFNLGLKINMPLILSNPHPSNTIALITGIWKFLSKTRRNQIYFTLGFTIINAFLEVLTIGSVIPFLTVLSSPDKVFSLPFVNSLLLSFHVYKTNDVIFIYTFLFIAIALFTAFFRLILLSLTSKLSFKIGGDLAYGIYEKTLYQPYLSHVNRNSSEIISAISNKANFISGAIMAIITFVSSIIFLLAILGALLYVNFRITTYIFFTFFAIYILITGFTRRKLLKNGMIVSQKSTAVLKTLQEGLGGIRDIILDNSQTIFSRAYLEADKPLRTAQANNLFLGSSPKYIIEAIGTCLIGFIAYSLSKNTDGLTGAIPTLGVLALSAQRILPILQQTYASWSVIISSNQNLKDTITLLDQKLIKQERVALKTITFKKAIFFEDISFRFNPEGKFIFRSINFHIKKGEKIGIIGKTGSGKSTLMDVLMGLLEPSEGYIKVDQKIIDQKNQKAWQKNIAHVPQFIFLSDASIRENIAFGIPPEKIDMGRLIKSTRQAQLIDFINSLPQGFDTVIGERGVKLSGGQRQRIGIARALYKKASLIILDEATSSLDNETEQEVMDAIYNNLDKKITVLMVAHRLSTLKNCDRIIELNSGILFEEIIK